MMCGFASSCGTAIHKASVATDTIANSLVTAANVNHQSFVAKVISLQEREQVAHLIEQAIEANDVLMAQFADAKAIHFQIGQISRKVSIGVMKAV